MSTRTAPRQLPAPFLTQRAVADAEKDPVLCDTQKIAAVIARFQDIGQGWEENLYRWHKKTHGADPRIGWRERRQPGANPNANVPLPKKSGNQMDSSSLGAGYPGGYPDSPPPAGGFPDLPKEVLQKLYPDAYVPAAEHMKSISPNRARDAVSRRRRALPLPHAAMGSSRMRAAETECAAAAQEPPPTELGGLVERAKLVGADKDSTLPQSKARKPTAAETEELQSFIDWTAARVSCRLQWRTRLGCHSDQHGFAGAFERPHRCEAARRPRSGLAEPNEADIRVAAADGAARKGGRYHRRARRQNRHCR